MIMITITTILFTFLNWCFLLNSSLLYSVLENRRYYFTFFWTGWKAPIVFCIKYCLKYVVFKWHTEVETHRRTQKFSQLGYYRQGRQWLLTLFTMVTRWPRSTSNFYALIGQNLTGEFMRKIYAALWNLFTVTAEADRVLCQLVMFLTFFFYWMYEF